MKLTDLFIRRPVLAMVVNLVILRGVWRGFRHVARGGTLDPASRCFLVKHGRDAVIARLDLSGMQDVISVLSGRAETVLACERIRTEVGDNPAIWLPRYLEETHATPKKSI